MRFYVVNNTLIVIYIAYTYINEGICNTNQIKVNSSWHFYLNDGAQHKKIGSWLLIMSQISGINLLTVKQYKSRQSTYFDSVRDTSLPLKSTFTKTLHLLTSLRLCCSNLRCYDQQFQLGLVTINYFLIVNL